MVKIANVKNDKLYYYLNENLIYEGYKNELELDLNPGTYKLYVVNQQGESDLRTFTVAR